MRKLTYLALLLPSAAAWAIDLQPGDLQVPPSGTRMIQLAYQDSDRGDMYVRGRKMPGEPKVTLSQTQLRLGATFDLGGMPAFSYLQQGGTSYTATPADWSSVISVRANMVLTGRDVDGKALTRNSSNVFSLRSRTL